MLLERCWQNFRTLFHRNDSLFDVLFLLAYFLEQLGLLYLIMVLVLKERLDLLPYTIGFFSLILVTTIGMNKLIMESRNRFIKERHIEAILDYYKLESKYNSLEKEYKEQNKLLKEIIEG